MGRLPAVGARAGNRDEEETRVLATDLPAGPAPARVRPLVAIALEGTLLDPWPGVAAVIQMLSGATPQDVAAFEATGEYRSPWEIARAAGPWVAAGRPRPIPPGGWRVVVNQTGRDPGDLGAHGRRLWELRGWRFEAPRVDAGRLRQLSEVANVVLVTGRDRRGLAHAEEVLGWTAFAATTSEDVLRPDPQVLLRHGATGHFVGSTAADRACAEAARFVYHDATNGLRAIVDRMIRSLQPTAAAP